MKILTTTLTGAPLNWAVAKCEGGSPLISWDKRLYGAVGDTFDYSIDWNQGGPIIDRELICLDAGDGSFPEHRKWEAHLASSIPMSRQEEITGPTALIAAMRCYVISKLGYEVDIPEELL